MRELWLPLLTMNGNGQPGGIGNGAVQNGAAVAASTVTANAQLTAAQRKALKERAADRYCPECGTHFRAKDVKWIRGTPACRVCGYKPLRKVKG